MGMDTFDANNSTVVIFILTVSVAISGCTSSNSTNTGATDDLTIESIDTGMKYGTDAVLQVDYETDKDWETLPELRLRGPSGEELDTASVTSRRTAVNLTMAFGENPKPGTYKLIFAPNNTKSIVKKKITFDGPSIQINSISTEFQSQESGKHPIKRLTVEVENTGDLPATGMVFIKLNGKTGRLTGQHISFPAGEVKRIEKENTGIALSPGKSQLVLSVANPRSLRTRNADNLLERLANSGSELARKSKIINVG